jgi:CheY-like chemotaxis protein
MKKIMIVDDDPDIIFSVKCGLEYFADDYIVLGAGSGHECFELLKKGQIPDLILLDIMMPGMTGWTVHDRLKAKKSPYNDIPIIFLTGATDIDSKEVGGWFGEDYIEKPFDASDLKERIDRVLKKQ